MNDHAPRTMQDAPNQPAPLLGEWMDRAELASELSVSPDTLKRWGSSRTGPAFTKIGRRVLYRREAVREWLRSREVAAVGERKAR